MKQILNNKYIKHSHFSILDEALMFLNNQDASKLLKIDDSFGDFHHFYIGCHSLTGMKEFVIYFSSDEQNTENLNLLFWDYFKLFVIDTGKNIYLINSQLEIEKKFEITTTLIGLFVTKKNNLLILEEASLLLTNECGEILNYELFDLIEDFFIKDDLLYIHTSEGRKEVLIP